jgi:hypothetical protein
MTPRIWSRILWSGAGLALYAPIPLFAAFPQAAPAFLRESVLGAPAGVWMVVGVIVLLTALTWICGAANEEGAAKADEGRPH